MDDEYMRVATWVVCPWCDEKKCVGRFNCDDIARWIDGKKKEEARNES